MKHLKILILISTVFFTAYSMQAQDKVKNITKTSEHVHPDYEKSIQEMQSVVEKAENTFQKAQETYAVTKEYDRTMDGREKTFISLISVIIGILSVAGIGSFSYNSFLNYKSKKEMNEFIKNSNERIKSEVIKMQADKIKEIIEKNDDIIIKLITSKEKDNYLRQNAKILVINHRDTTVNAGFKITLGLFEKFDFDNDLLNLSNLSEVLNTKNINKFKKVDLVIIENQAELGRWEIVPTSKELIRQSNKVAKNTPDKLKDATQNQKIMIELANKICDSTSIIYYGPGTFFIEEVNVNNQHLIAYAQSPSTLYSNIMNMLKYKDILSQKA